MSDFFDQNSSDADQTLAELDERPAEPSEEDVDLADVDLRLETADYYRAVLNHEFFDLTSPAAQQVHREIKAFIRERLEVLVGLRSPKPAESEIIPSFEEDEIAALKILAAKVLKRPSLMDEAPARPVVRKMAAPASDKKIKVVRHRPALRRAAAPPPAPSTKPTPRRPSSPKNGGSATGEGKTTAKKDATSQTIIQHDGKKVTLVEGQIIQEEGRKYQVVKNELGTLYRKDITGQVVPPGRLPQLTPQQVTVLSHELAVQQVSQLDETTSQAVLASLRQP